MSEFQKAIINSHERRVLLKFAYESLEALTDVIPLHDNSSEDIAELWSAYKIIKTLEDSI